MKLFNPILGLAAVWLLNTAPTIIVSAADDKQQQQQQPKYDPTQLVDIVPGRFIVEYAEPNVQATSKKLLDLLHGKFDSTNVSVSQSYDHPLMRGVTLRIDSTKKKDDDDDDDDENVVESMSTPNDDIVKEVIEMLEKQSMVSTVYPVRLVRRPELVPKPMSELDRRDAINMNAMQPHAMSQVERVHRELKNTGKGMVVGIIDSGTFTCCNYLFNIIYELSILVTRYRLSSSCSWQLLWKRLQGGNGIRLGGKRLWCQESW